VRALSFAFEAWVIRSAGGMAALGGAAVIVLLWIPAGSSTPALAAIRGDRCGDNRGDASTYGPDP
jgi:hypothetical protein